MKTLQMTCRECGGKMVLSKIEEYSGLSCPYCRSTDLLLLKSDRVQIAEIESATIRSGMEYQYREHRDHLDLYYSRRRIQIGIICAVALIVLMLGIIYVRQLP